MFPVTITVNNPQQLHAVMAVLSPKGSEENPLTEADAIADLNGTPRPTETAEARAPEATKAKNTPAAATAPAPQPSTATDAGASTDAAPALTYQDAATAVTNLAKAKGRDTAVAVLGKFGAAKLPDVKPEQFADVVKACKEAAEA